MNTESPLTGDVPKHSPGYEAFYVLTGRLAKETPMLLDGGAPIPPLSPGYDPPGPVSQFVALFIGVLLLAECATFLLSPEPLRYFIFRTAFERVWPFHAVGRWIRSWSRGE